MLKGAKGREDRKVSSVLKGEREEKVERFHQC